MWRSFTPYLVDSGFRVIAPDLAGFGQSSVHPQPGMVHYAADIQILLRHLRLSSVIVVGHSMGGYVGLELLAEVPEYLHGLSLFHSHPYADSPEKRANRHKSIRFIEEHGLKPYLRDFFVGLFPPAFAKKRPYILDELRQRAERYDPIAMLGALRAMAERKDHQQTLREARVPVQFLLGLEDPLLPQDQWIDQTHLPRIADIQLLDGVGHMGALEAPAICVRRIAEFATFCQTRIPLTS